jgi:hypothetical protein
MKIDQFLNFRKGRSPMKIDQLLKMSRLPIKIDHFLKKMQVAHESRPDFEFLKRKVAYENRLVWEF